MNLCVFPSSVVHVLTACTYTGDLMSGKGLSNQTPGCFSPTAAHYTRACPSLFRGLVVFLSPPPPATHPSLRNTWESCRGNKALPTHSNTFQRRAVPGPRRESLAFSDLKVQRFFVWSHHEMCSRVCVWFRGDIQG